MFSVTLIAAALLNQGLAETPPSKEDTIIVEGTRLRTNLDEAGSAISVLSATEMADRGLPFLQDHLATQAGVSVNQTGAFGGVSSVRLRGTTTGQTLILIDGVPVGDPASPGGGYDTSALDVFGLERVEILRGAQSALWGSDAIGGVINIQTRRPDNMALEAFAEVGSFESRRAGLFASVGKEGWGLSINALHHGTDGISKAERRDGNEEEDGFENRSVRIRGLIPLPKGGEIDASWAQRDTDTDLDGFSFTTFALTDTEDRVEADEQTGTLGVTFPQFWEGVDQRLDVGHYTLDRQNFSGDTPTFGTSGDRDILRYQATIDTSSVVQGVIGVEQEKTSVDGESVRIDSAFGVVRFTPIDQLRLSLGARNDQHTTFGNETTAQASINWELAKGLYLRSSWAEGFKAPTLFQLSAAFNPAFPANRDLRPETSTSFDVGIDWKAKTAERGLSVTWFDQDVTDQIDFAFTTSNYQNIARAKSRGVELAGFTELAESWAIDATATFQEAEDGTGTPLLRVPEEMASATLRYAHSVGANLGLTLIYNGEEVDITGPTPSWIRADISSSHPLTDTVDLYGRIENVTNTHYQQVPGYGTPGRSFTVGVRVR